MVKKRCDPATTPVASGRNPALAERLCKSGFPRHGNADQERERAPRDHKLARAISDANWGELVRQLEYKADWYGRELIKIDRYFPSSRALF